MTRADKKITVTTMSGDRASYDEFKVRKSLERSGATDSAIAEIMKNLTLPYISIS